MTKIALITAAFLVFALSAQAQDIITTTKGETIEAKILEVSSNEVKYKKFSYQDGPTFTINKKEIFKILYENGEEDVIDNSLFYNAIGEIHEGMKYKEYKDLYDASQYIREEGDQYRPFWSGFASFLIPGLGQGVDDEWGRALGFFAADLGLDALFLIGLQGFNSTERNIQKENAGATLCVLASIGLAIVDIYSIADAAHVAKVKNMYHQDIRSQRASLRLKLEPYLASTSFDVNKENQMFTGLSLKLTF